ncbi:MAG: hypothetical protein U0176_22295 [Bacteroidia bacterium]
MKIRFAILFLLLFRFVCSHAQTWHLLSSAPQASWRHDDIYFTDADHGWLVNVDGNIYRTTDGGTSWATLLQQPATSFRCVGFADTLRGWVGNLGLGSWSPTTDTIPLYGTTDGGLTWTPATIIGPTPAGICGINVVTDSVAYAVGRVGGPGHILKTTNAGQTWISTPAPSPMFYLIDVKFFSPDTGFVSGTTGALNSERPAIFRTVDGGQNWQQVAGLPNFQGICWKMTFPSRQVGYSSVEAWQGQDSIPVMKTTDGGLSWTPKLQSVPYFWDQGIGFIDEQLGYCGSTTNKRTTDGGDTWTNWALFPHNFNRFRRINDSIAYACGNRVYKYSVVPVAVDEPVVEASKLQFEAPALNPFRERTKISYVLPVDGEIDLRVYDWTGRPVKVLAQGWQRAGKHHVVLELDYHGNARFYLSLRQGEDMATQSVLMVR